MHEMSLVGDVIEVANRYARENDATSIAKVSLVIGELRDVVDDLLVSCFSYLSRGTLCEGAELEFEKIPLRVKCSECNTVHPADLNDESSKICPKCSSSRSTIYSGWEFLIDTIEIC